MKTKSLVRSRLKTRFSSPTTVGVRAWGRFRRDDVTKMAETGRRSFRVVREEILEVVC